MRIIDSFEKLPEEIKGNVLTMGNFDGVHIGHQTLIRTMVAHAEKMKTQSIVMTFNPHPLKIVQPEKKLRFISTFKEVTRYISDLGVDYLLAIPFNKQFSQQTATAFLDQVITRYLEPCELIMGQDHRFGFGRSGSIDLLRKYCQRAGWGMTVVPPVYYLDEIISSTRIRTEIKAGRIETVNGMLGRPFRVSGIVQKGSQRGTELGFPTANLKLNERVVPPNGVYVSRACFQDNYYSAITYIGDSPTFEPTEIRIETHLFHVNEKLYGQELTVDFLSMLRPEIKFDSTRALIEQIKKDVENSLHFSSKYNST